jgi:CRP/FNR family transcriptional regulator, cyclic AMP receptor protein
MKEIDPVAENCSLANITLLQTLSEEARSAIERKCSWIEFDPNDVILDRVGDDQHEVFFLVRGTVRIMNFAGDRQEIALADLEEGSNFGELSAVDCRGRSARVLGSENCIIARLDREDFIAMLMENPKMSLDLLDRFAGIIRNLTERISTLSALSPHQRIFLELLRISEPNPKGDGTWLIDVVPAHKEIASWSGTDKLDVANAIGGLVRNGVMERRHRSFEIKDHAKLKLLAGLE